MIERIAKKRGKDRRVDMKFKKTHLDRRKLVKEKIKKKKIKEKMEIGSINKKERKRNE